MAAQTFPLSEDRDPRIEAELIYLLYRHSIPTLISAYVAGVVVAVMIYGRGAGDAIWWWLAALFGVTTIRIGVTALFLRKPARQEHSSRWHLIFSALAAASGTAWGTLNTFFFDGSDLVITVLLCVVPGGLSSNAVGTMSPSMRSYVAFVTPIAILFALRVFSEEGDLYTTIGVLGMLYFVINLGNSLRLHRTLKESTRLRFINMDLVHQLTEEKERAEAATLDKTRFLAAASHDLRQPIHALGLFGAALANIARRPAVKPEDISDIAQRLQASVKHLGQLLHAILDTSHLDAGVLKPKSRAVAVRDEFEGLLDKFAPVAAGKGIRLIVRDTECHVWTDPIFLRRILSNLVSNALRYTRRGSVLVACRTRGNKVEIQVWDTGIGIPQNQQARIFDDFFRVDNPGQDRELDQGLGLGLAIVKRSSQLINAQVRVRSIPGKGSMFSVVLPRCEAPEVPDAGEVQELPEELRILVIDDDLAVLKATAALLEEWGHTVVAVSDVEAALQAVRRQEFDQVLSDYRLASGTTGVDAIYSIWTVLKRKIPGVIITGDIAPQSIREIMASGLRMLQKPIEPDELRAAIHSND